MLDLALALVVALLAAVLSGFFHWILIAVCAALFLFYPTACLALLAVGAAARYFTNHR